ncbi:MAG TPA: aspartyl protease family protein [Rhizomicrobium sp.]|nr:aspartyl protease family protein [Rhizomicrobium sp.]
MHRFVPAVLLLASSLLALPAQAFTPYQVLDANKVATGNAWNDKKALDLHYAYVGQGLTGTAASLDDLVHGAFVDSYAIPPNTGASGYDGERPWEKEPSGTVTYQAGGDTIPLAITESYQDRNLWWRKDRGGAAVESLGRKSDHGASFDVLRITPNGGAALECWFDAKTHLLARTIELQGTQTITTFYSNYTPVDGVQLAHKMVIDDGSGPQGLQTLTLTSARFLKAQDPARFAKPDEHLDDYSIAGGATETTVPFRLLNNHIYADVSVNGSAPMTFIFDTGGHTILTPETTKALDIKAQGAVTASGGGDALAQSGETTLHTITVGGVTLKNQAASVLTFSPKGVEGVNEQGMLGYELFARFVTRIDYGDHTLTFIDKKHFDPAGAGTAVPIRLYHQFPEVLGSYDGIPARFGIDTGSRMTLMLTAPFAREHHLLDDAAQTTLAVIGWGVGGPSRGYVFHGGTLKLGDVTIDHPLTSISTDKGGAGASPAFPNNVGGGVLKRFVVTLDYDHLTMYLKPIEGVVADLDTFDRCGIWINAVDGGFKIFDVTTNSPAEQAGLVKDDIITAVDGRPAAALELAEVRRMLRDEPPGTAVTFAVKHGDETRNVTFTLRDLI